MNLKDIFTTKFLFEVDRVSPILSIDKVIALFGVVLVVLAAVLKLAAVFAPTPVDRQFRNKFFSVFLTIGLLEIMWYGLRYQNIQVLGTRTAALLIAASGLVWFGFVLKAFIKNYSKDKEGWEKEQLKMKYLPK